MSVENRVYNFTPGPAMLPLEVLEEVQENFVDFQGIGASIIEISHREPRFIDILEQAKERVRRLLKLPKNFQVLYVSGGGTLQMALVGMNLMGAKPAKKAFTVDTGFFAQKALGEMRRYGDVKVLASGKESNYSALPKIDYANLPKEASFFYFVGNNTIYGTQWQTLPSSSSIPLVVDFTSDFFSRPLDFEPIGLAFGGLQKNLGPAGLSLVVVREDMVTEAIPETPLMLDLKQLIKTNSMPSTINTFALYVHNLVLGWIEKQGGLEVMEKWSLERSQEVYRVLDSSTFYQAHARKEDRSRMNVTFRLSEEEMTKKFLEEALKENLYALGGHRFVGGVRASMYNAMPLSGAKALASFMQEFERKNG